MPIVPRTWPRRTSCSAGSPRAVRSRLLSEFLSGCGGGKHPEQGTSGISHKVSGRWQKEEMALKHVQAKLQQQQAVLAKEVQDLKETLEVRKVAWGRGAGRSVTLP